MYRFMSAENVGIIQSLSYTGVLVAATKKNKEQAYAEKRLTTLGFSDEDLRRCSRRGWSALDILNEINRWGNADVTTDAYARETFEEAYPELFKETQIVEMPTGEMSYKEDKKPKNEIANFVNIMKSDDHYAGIRFNELSGRAEVHRVDGDKLTITPWSDADEAQSMMYIESNFGLYSKDKHTAALRILFRERTYNPIRDIVDGIKWDGEPRCQDFLHRWAKVEDTPYTREVSRLIFAGGINRLYLPGCKFEDVPILMGKQRSGKSSLIRFLAINDDYFGELKDMEGQQAIENLQGKWILEIPEMSAFTKAKDQESIKAFVSRQRDQYRKPFDRNTTELPRRCIFLSTSNDLNPLVDKTGNRRWYPIEVHSDGYEIFDHEAEIREYALQCWAEAKAKLKTEEMQPFANRNLLKDFAEAQDNAMQDDWRVGAIQAYLERKLPGELTCVREVAHRALSANPDMPKEPSLVESKDIGKILNMFSDWERIGSKRIANYGVQKCWRKKDDAPFPETEEPFTEG